MSKSFADMASGLISSASKTEQESDATVAAPKRNRKPKAGTDLMNEYKAERKARQVTVLIKPSLYEAGKAFAQANGLKSFNNFVNYAIERALIEK